MTRNNQPIGDAPGSNIEYSPWFAEIETAREWGLTPARWIKEPRWSRAVMVAQRHERSTINYWVNEDNKPKGKK